MTPPQKQCTTFGDANHSNYCWWFRNPANHLVCKNPTNNGRSYQPQLVSRISAINSITPFTSFCCILGWFFYKLSGETASNPHPTFPPFPQRKPSRTCLTPNSSDVDAQAKGAHASIVRLHLSTTKLGGWVTNSFCQPPHGCFQK